MSLFDLDFDPQTEEGTRYDLIPPRVYMAVITDASVAATKNNSGQQVHFTWKILGEGPHENRPVWQSILFAHTNAQAVKIGRAKLKDVCVACGVEEKITDLDVFKFKECTITIAIEPGKDGYDPRNKITRVRPRELELKPITGGKVDPGFNDSIPF
jgi:hypothetical protein